MASQHNQFFNYQLSVISYQLSVISYQNKLVAHGFEFIIMMSYVQEKKMQQNKFGTKNLRKINLERKTFAK